MAWQSLLVLGVSGCGNDAGQEARCTVAILNNYNLDLHALYHPFC